MKKWLTLAVAFVMLFGLMSVAGAQTQFGLEPMESRQTLRVVILRAPHTPRRSTLPTSWVSLTN